VIVDVTAAELEKHRKAIGKLRAAIFEPPPSDYRVIPESIEIHPPSAQEMVHLGTRAPYRELTLGGLSFVTATDDFPRASKVMVLHSEADTFTLWVSQLRHDHTRFAVTTTFKELRADIDTALRSALREDRQVPSVVR
jgi:hypothetical protein